MGAFVSIFGLRGGPTRIGARIAFIGGVAGLLAGCADSQRFSDPLGNPFASRSGDQTATVPQHQAQSTAIQSRPVPPPSGSAANYSAPAHSSPRLAANAPASGPAATSTVGHGGPAGWSAEGGMPIIVANGESADILAKRYGVPLDALLHTNGFASSAQVRPGTRVIVPVYNASLAASSGARVAPPQRVASAQHLAEKRETLKFVKGPQPVDKRGKEMPNSAKGAPPAEHGKTAVAAAKAEAAKKHVAEKAEAAREDRKPINSPVAKADLPAAAPKVVDPTPTASVPAPAKAAAAAAADTNPEFRWPARGRIIQAFKAGGNDGINIAVPEGTSVKAAEGGVVAYAGNELKGYGNLILIRHPNGFVSAYANNGELDVKRGETVKRGQVIAKSGQSGNVASPQLHFELRKGATPVDPTQYLAGL